MIFCPTFLVLVWHPYLSLSWEGGPLAFVALGGSSRWAAPLEGDLVLQLFHSQVPDLALTHPLNENSLLPLVKSLIKLCASDLKCACIVFKIPPHHFSHGKKYWVEFTTVSHYEEYWRKENGPSRTLEGNGHPPAHRKGLPLLTVPREHSLLGLLASASGCV